MPRPTTKTDLIETANGQYNKLCSLIDTMTEEEQHAVLDYGDGFQRKEAHWKRDKNLRDVLVHLYEWHQLLLNWVESNQNGDPKPFLPAPYNWKTYGQMNVGFWEKNQDTPYEDSKAMLQESHSKVIDMIETFSNDELFAKAHFSWTGNNTLGSYCVSTTSSHYEWAMKKIKQYLKACRSQNK